MPRLDVAVIELIPNGPDSGLWNRLFTPNLAGIMPPVIATWCEQEGHRAECFVYTGFEDLMDAVAGDRDVVFVSAFTRSALLAYAVSHLARERGAVTVLGGPHARCYPDDACRHFDYVLGFTDRELIGELLRDPAPQRPRGVQLAAPRQPAELPSLRERWKFVAPTLDKTPFLKLVPMVGSLGCPYTCSFCIDADVEYQPLPFEQLREDLRFVRATMPRPRIGWHDPNFGVRFDDYMDAIEDAAPPGSMEHVAESSLSLLSEPRLRRLRANGFKAILPGIESWYELGGKSRTGADVGEAKVERVAEHVNTILRYIPYVQANFVFGLDTERGPEPFELTKKFIDLVPGAFPAFSLLTAFGEAAPLNLGLQRDGRVLPFPFHFLDNYQSMNVVPAHYEWREFYDHVIDVTAYAYSWRSIRRRLGAQGPGTLGWINFARAMANEGTGRIRYHRMIRESLDDEPSMLRFFNGETTELPDFYRRRARQRLGPFWEHLPEGGLEHDPNAYLAKTGAASAPTREAPVAAGG